VVRTATECRTPSSGHSLLRLLLAFCLVSLLAGCAMVQVESVRPKDFVASKRGDVLTTGQWSNATLSALQVLGLDESRCLKDRNQCRQKLVEREGLNDEQRQSALAEIWLDEALKLDEDARRDPFTPELKTTARLAHLRVVQHSYAYLFFTQRNPADRALEDRQAQVRDYYNYATQQALVGLFNESREDIAKLMGDDNQFVLPFGPWTLYGRTEGLVHGAGLPQELVSASTLQFNGLRNQYRRDGLGAEVVAVYARQVAQSSRTPQPWTETPFPAVTLLLRFEGQTLEEVLATQRIEVLGLDPHRQRTVTLHRTQVPVAGNFTAGYGLWLARSGFARQSLLTLIGRGDVLESPQIYLMQPYDPNRKILVMLHGLASSPEAWVNVANEVLGDETLRQNFQIWQVYYPTNLPLALNNQEIRQALAATLAHFDPKGRHVASRDMVLLGHSMGGVLARLMVSDSGDELWNALIKPQNLSERRRERLRDNLGPLLVFKPLPFVNRAIFVATPHRGTDFADNRFARFVSSLIKLPANVLGRITEVAQLLVDPDSAAPVALNRPFNSIDNLSDLDPFVNRSAELPISPSVKLHSLIGNDTPGRPLGESTDGVVPYRSAHLEGVESELVIDSWHSVQEDPEAIVEIRRILRQHLEELGL